MIWGVSVDTTILHTFLSAPACTALTDMVYSKELEHDVTTTAMAKAIHAMCKMLLFSAKIGKTAVHFLRFDKKLKKSGSGLRFSSQRKAFFNIAFGLFSKVSHIYMEQHG